MLAAGLILLSGWNGECDLIDPMCGSGTIAIEAALIAKNIMPGIFRKEFAFERWQDFDRALLDAVYNDDSQERPFDHHIYGYDINRQAVEAALANVKSAGVSGDIDIVQRPIQEFKRPEKPALIITNPPYGERISSPDLLGLYRTIGERLKNEFSGNEAWILSYREECFDQIGLKPSFKIPLFNGSLDCEFRKYILFDGKLSRFREAGEELKTTEERKQMAEKKRFKQHRDFKNRFEDDEEQAEHDGIPAYVLRKHRDFEESRRRETRRQNRPERENNDTKREKRTFERNHNGERGFRDERERTPRNDRNAFRGEKRSFNRNGKPFNKNKKDKYED